jgi:hypothetical protein
MSENEKPEDTRKYKDNVEGMSEDKRWPTGAMPKAPDPSPFKVGG